MDPIHPIIPQPPTIPPVAPSPQSGRIDREHRRNRDGGGARKRREDPDATVEIDADAAADQLAWEALDGAGFDEEADGGLHVDVSA